MPRKASSFKVGIFVILGMALVFGGIFYLGLSRRLDRSPRYSTFFNESVQGLNRDSVVKYLGVSVGRVVEIRVAPDYKLIEVLMEIKFAGDPGKELVAQLKSVGITGLSFIELTRRKKKDPDESPTINFAAEYPIIPSKPSETARIFSSIEKITRQLGKVDFEKMLQSIQDILQAAKKIVTDDRLSSSLENLENATKNLDSISAEAKRQIFRLKAGALGQDMSKLINEARTTVEKGNLLLDSTRQEITDMKLPNTTKNVRDLVAGLNKNRQELMAELLIVGQSLQETTDQLKELMRELKQNPSQALFSKPQPPRELN